MFSIIVELYVCMSLRTLCVLISSISTLDSQQWNSFDNQYLTILRGPYIYFGMNHSNDMGVFPMHKSWMDLNNFCCVYFTRLYKTANISDQIFPVKIPVCKVNSAMQNTVQLQCTKDAPCTFIYTSNIYWRRLLILETIFIHFLLKTDRHIRWEVLPEKGVLACVRYSLAEVFVRCGRIIFNFLKTNETNQNYL